MLFGCIYKLHNLESHSDLALGAGMSWQASALTVAIAWAAFGQPAFGQPNPRREDSVAVVARGFADNAMTRPFKPISGEAFYQGRLDYCTAHSAPYCPRHTYVSSASKTKWLAQETPVALAQLRSLPELMVLYLPSCEFDKESFLLGQAGLYPGDIDEETFASAADAVDEAIVSGALTKAGITDIAIPEIEERVFDRAAPPVGLKQVNDALWARHVSGRLPTPHLIVERYCGPEEPAPAGFIPPSPAPNPPPPSPRAPKDPFVLQLTHPAQALYIIPAFSGDLCRLRTGTPFDLSCRGWIKLSGNSVHELARTFYYIHQATTGHTNGKFEVTEANRSGTPIVIP